MPNRHVGAEPAEQQFLPCHGQMIRSEGGRTTFVGGKQWLSHSPIERVISPEKVAEL